MTSRASLVVMGEGQAVGARKRYSLQNAVVDQFIVKDQVLWAEQMTDGCDIGDVTADKAMASSTP